MINVTELQLEEHAEALGTIAATSDVQFLNFRPWIALIEKDVRVHLELPFHRTVVDELRKIVIVFVEFMAEDLTTAPGAARRPVTTPTKLKRLQQTGESILVDLGPYAELADHYYDDTVKRARLSRPSNEVSAEIDAITEKARDLRERFLKYLNDLNLLIAETSDREESPG